MTGQVQRMIRGAIGGAALGGGIGGTLFSAVSALMVGIEPVVFLLCGVYAGMVYGGIVGAVRGARQQPVDTQPGWNAAPGSRVDLIPAVVRSRNR
jgi:hypothetical protein